MGDPTALSTNDIAALADSAARAFTSNIPAIAKATAQEFTNHIPAIARATALEADKLHKDWGAFLSFLLFVAVFFLLLWVVSFGRYLLLKKPGLWRVTFAFPIGAETSVCRLHSKVLVFFLLGLGSAFVYCGAYRRGAIPVPAILLSLISEEDLWLFIMAAIVFLGCAAASFCFATWSTAIFRHLYSVSQPLVPLPQLASVADVWRSWKLNKSRYWEYLNTVCYPGFEKYADLTATVLIDATSVKGVHLMLSADTLVPDISNLPKMLFFQEQRKWSTRFQDRDIDLGRAQGSEYKFFNTRGNEPVGELDTITGSAMITCLKNLGSSHNTLRPGSVNLQSARLPRAVRLIFGSESDLVKLVRVVPSRVWADYFDKLSESTLVLNLWFSKRLLKRFDVPLWCKSREIKCGPVGFESPAFEWQEVAQRFATGHDFILNDTALFRRFALRRSIWAKKLDFLAFGTVGFQLGYDKMDPPNTNSESANLSKFVGALPIILMACHFKRILSFRDLVEYIHISITSEEPDKSTAKRIKDHQFPLE